MAHPPETKAAVMAALLVGQSVSSIAQEYGVNQNTIRTWKSQSDFVNKIDDKKSEIIGDLIVRYLEGNLTALYEQTQVFRDETWLKRQTASDLAVLHGVMTDKAIRLVEALNKGSDDSPPDAA